MAGRKIALALLQPIEAELAAEISAHLEPLFQCQCIISNTSLPLAFAFDAQRKQYNSTAILARAKMRLLADADILLAIVDEDIYAAGMNFIFGEAEVGGRAAIISLARLRAEFYQQARSFALLSARACKEATHELGHVFGLAHCEKSRCGMYFSATLADTDHKRAHFCADCMHTLAIKLLA